MHTKMGMLLLAILTNVAFAFTTQAASVSEPTGAEKVRGGGHGGGNGGGKIVKSSKELRSTQGIVELNENSNEFTVGIIEEFLRNYGTRTIFQVEYSGSNAEGSHIQYFQLNSKFGNHDGIIDYADIQFTPVSYSTIIQNGVVSFGASSTYHRDLSVMINDRIRITPLKIGFDMEEDYSETTQIVAKGFVGLFATEMVRTSGVDHFESQLGDSFSSVEFAIKLSLRTQISSATILELTPLDLQTFLSNPQTQSINIASTVALEIDSRIKIFGSAGLRQEGFNQMGSYIYYMNFGISAKL